MARSTIQRSGVVCVLSLAVLLAWQGKKLLPETSPVARGAEYGRQHGCIDCHGQTDKVIFENADSACRNNDRRRTHPHYTGNCHDLLAYFESVRLKRTFRVRASIPNPNRLLQGERLARQYNCFQCHGELGQGGFRNRGALKGYIPGYFGKDFWSLTDGGRVESVRTWITQGVDQSLYKKMATGAIARYFIERQAVSMPGFASLPDAEIQILVDYVIALNRLGKLDAKAIRSDSKLTQLDISIPAAERMH